MFPCIPACPGRFRDFLLLLPLRVAAEQEGAALVLDTDHQRRVVHEAILILQNFLAKDIVFLIVCVPFMVLSLIVLMAKVKETRDVDLENVTADTFR